ncbi:hypothetical protein STEG23_023183 [Scotinomys teguina]
MKNTLNQLVSGSEILEIFYTFTMHVFFDIFVHLLDAKYQDGTNTNIHLKCDIVVLNQIGEILHINCKQDFVTVVVYPWGNIKTISFVYVTLLDPMTNYPNHNSTWSDFISSMAAFYTTLIHRVVQKGAWRTSSIKLCWVHEKRKVIIYLIDGHNYQGEFEVKRTVARQLLHNMQTSALANVQTAAFCKVTVVCGIKTCLFDV